MTIIQFSKNIITLLLDISIFFCFSDCYAQTVNYETENITSLTNMAKKGDVVAMHYLADRYDDYQEYSKALKWWKKAAEKGYADSQLSLGWCYMQGKGVETNLEVALYWWEKAAEQGNTGAQLNLGMALVTTDAELALKWWKKAAEQGGDAAIAAMTNIAATYHNGDFGITKNYTEAVKWWKKAAEQGDAYAEYQLGYCYWEGEGVPQNMEKAQFWFKKAADQGYEDAIKVLENYF